MRCEYAHALYAGRVEFLDRQRLLAITPAEFEGQKPFPWWNPRGLLHDEAYALLCRHAPPAELFEADFGRPRKFGQRSHDRLTLRYDTELPIHEVWHAFVRELQSEVYTTFLSSLFHTTRFRLRTHWHYTPVGCSVSPHCDSQTKLGSHLFYLNPEAEWKPEWGGSTRLLAVSPPRSAPSRRSHPDFDDFDAQIETNAVGNVSLLFRRREDSWHGMAPLHCPKERVRRVFTVVLEDTRWYARWRLGLRDRRRR